MATHPQKLFLARQLKQLDDKYKTDRNNIITNYVNSVKLYKKHDIIESRIGIIEILLIRYCTEKNGSISIVYVGTHLTKKLNARRDDSQLFIKEDDIIKKHIK